MIVVTYIIIVKSSNWFWAQVGWDLYDLAVRPGHWQRQVRTTYDEQWQIQIQIHVQIHKYLQIKFENIKDIWIIIAVLYSEWARLAKKLTSSYISTAVQHLVSFVFAHKAS